MRIFLFFTTLRADFTIQLPPLSHSRTNECVSTRSRGVLPRPRSTLAGGSDAAV